MGNYAVAGYLKNTKEPALFPAMSKEPSTFGMGVNPKSGCEVQVIPVGIEVTTAPVSQVYVHVVWARKMVDSSSTGGWLSSRRSEVRLQTYFSHEVANRFCFNIRT